MAEDVEFKRRAAAIEKSRREIAALQERIRGLRRRYAKAEGKSDAKAEPTEELRKRRRAA